MDYILKTVDISPITLGRALTIVGSSLGLAVALMLVYMFTHRRTGWRPSIAMTMLMLGPIVSIIVLCIGSNIARAISIGGGLALVRFRSVPGSAKEITGLFFSVALGLACGMGYVAIAGLFFVIISLFLLLLERFRFGQNSPAERQLKITIPENLDYDGLFDDLLNEYTLEHELIRVRTTNMGTLYELTYNIRLRGKDISKDFIDALRCRNGNLTVSCGREADRDMM